MTTSVPLKGKLILALAVGIYCLQELSVYKTVNRFNQNQAVKNVTDGRHTNEVVRTNDDMDGSELTKEYIGILADSIARAYKKRDLETICSSKPNRLTTNSSSPTMFLSPPEGLIYVKVPKAASSTLAGVNIRIARKRGDNCTNHEEGHVIFAGRYYGNRVKDRSYLWASLRNPATRALSRVYFYFISQVGHNATDDVILRFLRKARNPQTGTTSLGRGGFQFQYIMLSLDAAPPNSAWNETHPTIVRNPASLMRGIKSTFDEYNFMALTERMDESLVVLKFLLGVEIADILSFSSKAGSYTHTPSRGDVHCLKLIKSSTSPAVQRFFESPEWQAMNFADYVLHEAASRSLDITIKEVIGRERFERALEEYRQMMSTVKQRCKGRAFFPCSENGTEQTHLSEKDCYDGDAGCGYRCIDDVVIRTA